MDSPTIVFLTPAHTAPLAPAAIYLTLVHALDQLDDGREITDFNIVGAVSVDVQSGLESLLTMVQFQRIDGIITFGKTCASLGLPDMTMLEPTTVHLRHQVDSIRCVRLPSPISRWWADEDSPHRAGAAVKSLLVPPPTTISAPAHLVWASPEFN